MVDGIQLRFYPLIYVYVYIQAIDNKHLKPLSKLQASWHIWYDGMVTVLLTQDRIHAVE